MRMNSECAVCVWKTHWALVENEPNDDVRLSFVKRAMASIAKTDSRFPAPVLTAELQAIYQELYPGKGDFSEKKRFYNEQMLSRLPDLRNRLSKSRDALKGAIWMAIAANYIDFGILTEIDEEKLEDMLFTPDARVLERELDNFRRDLISAKNVLYALDNCGEAVLDLLVIEALKKEFPHISITALVRAKPIVNDVTMDDARQIGLDKIARVIGNGSNICGTQLDLLSPEAKRAADTADIIISKGQGNFETLSGCGLNVYYLFLTKCRLYEKLFGLPYFTGAFINERRFFPDGL